MPRYLVFVFLFLSFWALPSLTLADSADSAFSTTYDILYEPRADEVTEVSQKISLTNKLANVYATSYSLTLVGAKIQAIRASDAQGPLALNISQEDETTKIDFTFNQRVVGVGQTLTFNLFYEAFELARKNGNVWEITIPRFGDAALADNYRLKVRVPLVFGEKAYISPQPSQTGQEGGFQVFTFDKEVVGNLGIVAAFGQFQVFTFGLTYHLENPYPTFGTTQIALPPDTAYQRLIYQKIDPPPQKVTVDVDGNWLAKYRLNPGQKVGVVAQGLVEIYAQPRLDFPVTSPDPALHLARQPFWETDNPEIVRLAQELKTPEAIYDYIVTQLSYDYNRVAENVDRLGAAGALAKPQSAICMEFTDLFIALSRAAGIPARELNGFAYTTNAKLRPLSLVRDVLHAWPEYWDSQRQVWVPVDPTWGNTTGGVDYFGKLDLNHFVFAIHGADSQTPYPAGAYKAQKSQSKDVEVSFGQYSTTPPLSQVEVEFNLAPFSFAGLPYRGTVVLKNRGQVAIFGQGHVATDKMQIVSEGKISLPVIPPYSQITIPISLKNSNLLALAGDELKLTVGKDSFGYNIIVLPFIATLAGAIFGGITLGITIYRLAQKTRRLSSQRGFRLNPLRRQG